MPNTSASRRSDGKATHRILVVDDEPSSSALVAYHLARAGYGVTTAANGREGMDTARKERPELAVLSAVLPDVSGYEVLAELRRREETREIGILLLTGRQQKAGPIKGLTMGADDCLAKPFAPQELVLRVGAILRRLTAPALTTRGRLVAGPVTLDETSHSVQVSGGDVALTSTEFKLLRALIERDGRVQTRAQLLETVWHAPPDVQTRTMDMHMQRLRHKLGPAGACIETVRGTGYRFRWPPPPSPV
ncbi:MAG TPA: response regulator transcription factor [Xanthobacteraceae bacterium]|nr:response regulator transcription factor [Xanthobacteraceae bacterium]